MILLILGLLTLEPQTPALLILVLPTLGLPTLVLLTRGLEMILVLAAAMLPMYRSHNSI